MKGDLSEEFHKYDDSNIIIIIIIIIIAIL